MHPSHAWSHQGSAAVIITLRTCNDSSMSCREQAPEPEGVPKYCEAYKFTSGSGVVLTRPCQFLLKARNDARILRVQLKS
jgi:hypothetical protein